MTDIKKPVLPHGWIVKQSSSYPDRVYYFNVNTGCSTWQVPALKSEQLAKQKPPNTNSSQLKPTIPNPKYLSQVQNASLKDKKSVPLAEEPQFSPDIETPVGGDNDLFDLNDDDQATNDGHKHHMAILQEFDSPAHSSTSYDERRNPKSFSDQRRDLPVGGHSLSFDEELACMQDVDMRPGHGMYQANYHRPLLNQIVNNSHRPELKHTVNNLPQTTSQGYGPVSFSKNGNPSTSLFSASTLDNSDSKGYHEQTQVLRSLDSVDDTFNTSQHPLRITPEISPHTHGQHQSFNYSERDMSSSFQTLPSVHSNLLPGYHKFSSTPVEKRTNEQKTNVTEKFYKTDRDFRKGKKIEMTVKYDSSHDPKNDQTNDERKRRLNDLWKTQKDVKKIKCNENSNDQVKLNVQLSDPSQKPKVLPANDLRHKVPKKEGNKNKNMNEDLRSRVLLKRHIMNTDPRQRKHDSQTVQPLVLVSESDNRDIRRVVSRLRETGCSLLSDLKSEDLLRDRSPMDSDDNNMLDNVHIDAEKRLSIQSWIDNLQPDAQPISDEEDLSSKRTSPDSGVLSVTCSNKSDNRRIVMEKCGLSLRTVDSGISSVSNNSMFQPIVETWGDNHVQFQPNNCWKGVHAQAAAVDHTRDIIDMEIDDVQNKVTDSRQIEEMEVVDIVVREVRDSLKNRFTEVVGMLTEMVSADQNTSTSYSLHKGLFIVVDTNILIDHLNFLQDLRDTNIPAHGRPLLVFPWVVMQELDYLKTAKTAKASLSLSTAKKAREAVQYLYQCLQSNHPRVIGQTPVQASLSAGEFIAESNDDRILQCCLQCQNNNPDCLVVLLSNDKNLCNKSLVMGIKAFPQQTILSALSMECIVLNKKATGGNKKNDQNKPSQSKENWRQRPLENDTKYLDDVYCKVKSLIQEALSIILEREMKKIYGDIWLSIVLKKPPWSYRDLLECFKKHWIAVFGQIYNRALIKCVQRLLDKVIKGGTVTWTIVEEMITDSVELLNEDMKHEKYQNEVARFVKDLKNCRVPHQTTEENKEVKSKDRKQTYTEPACNYAESKQTPAHRKRKPSGKSPINRKSPILSSQQVFSKSEIKLQQIWQTIHKFCVELKEIAAGNDSPQKRVYLMCEKLIPAVKDLQYHYNLALSIPPDETRSKLENVIGLCDHLNSFHNSVEIQDSEGPIETFDLLDLFATEDKRSVLEKGHVQLQEMIKDIYTCVQQLPDEGD